MGFTPSPILGRSYIAIHMIEVEAALKFVEFVEEKLPTTNCCVIEYSDKHPEFYNAEFRAIVLGVLRCLSNIGKTYFTGPCELDSDWQFVAYRRDS